MKRINTNENPVAFATVGALSTPEVLLLFPTTPLAQLSPSSFLLVLLLTPQQISGTYFQLLQAKVLDFGTMLILPRSTCVKECKEYTANPRKATRSRKHTYLFFITIM